jgi:hypothetical protein
VREKTRTQVGLIVETGDAREMHHFALLIGYGAGAINPYLSLDSLGQVQADGYIEEGISVDELQKHYLKAIKKGVVKVMSKMGISTIHSYRGAQIFEAIGLAEPFIDRYFTKTVSRIGGIGADEVAVEAASTSGAATANSTCSIRTRCSSSSTRPAPAANRFSESTQSSLMTRPSVCVRSGACSN